MASKNTKTMVKRILELAAGFALGSVVGVPLVLWVKSKLNV